jgi:tetratricopeptide (TPR) repeat protein
VRPNTAEPAAWKLRAALGLLALAAYANSFGLGLALDARSIVYGDPRLRAVTAENLRAIRDYDYWWPSSIGRVYRPVATASLLFNYAVLGSGERPASYHGVNFALHLVNVWLVLALARRVLKSQWPGFFAAALWAVHPAGVESVTNVAGRADLLAAMGALGGLLWYVRSRELRGRRLAAACAALVVVATLGVLSKENAAALAGLLVVWEAAFGQEPWLGLARSRLPQMLAVAASLAVLWGLRRQVFGATPWPESAWADNPLEGAGLLASRLTALKVIALDLGLLLFPARLSYDWSYNQIPVAADAGAWCAAALVMGLLAVAVARRRRDPVMFWCAGFYGVALLPVSNLIFLTGAIRAERFLYLPSVAFAIAVTALVYRWKPGRPAAAILSAAILLCAARTLARNPVWESDLTLAQSGVESAPDSYRPHDMLANALFQQDPKRNLDRAIAESERAWAILSPLPPERIFQLAPARLGMLYRQKGELDKALAVLLRAREASRAHEREYDQAQLAHGKPLTPPVAYQPLFFDLGATLLQLGRHAEAHEAYRYARLVNPGLARGYDELAAAYAAAGQADQAAVVVDEKALLEGLTPQNAASLRAWYARLPGGECAFAGDRLNPQCARLRSDLCAAWSDLTDTFTEARLTTQADQFRATAARDFGCK